MYRGANDAGKNAADGSAHRAANIQRT